MKKRKAEVIIAGHSISVCNGGEFVYTIPINNRCKVLIKKFLKESRLEASEKSKADLPWLADLKVPQRSGD